MKKIKEFIKENFLYVGTFFCMLCAVELMRVPIFCATIVRVLTLSPSQYPLIEVLTYFLVVVGDALLLSIPALFVRKRLWILYLWIFIVELFCQIQIWYVAVYEDLMPVSYLVLFDNVNTVLLRSVGGLLRMRDILTFLPLLLFAVSVYVVKKKNWLKKSRIRKKIFIPATIASAVAFFALANVYGAYDNDFKPGDRSLLYHVIAPANNGSFVEYNGVVSYIIYSVINSLPSPGLSDDERREVDSFIAEKPNYTDNSYSVAKGKNLIIIVVESFNSWYLNLTVCGVEIMPNVNALLREKGTVSSLRVIPQVKDGRSSDGHFIINTGLLPLSRGAVAVSYAEHEYPSIAKALKARGYATYNIVCDDHKGWNQAQMSESLGYDHFYDRTRYGYDYIMPDSALFKNTLSEIKRMKQPFMIQMVTLATHQPGFAPDHPTALSSYKGGMKSVINAMEDFHLLDRDIGRFIDSLKESGVYDNSVVVIVSDHDDVGFNEFENREERLATDRECVFIALNTSHTLAYPNVVGQVDIYPTIMDIMGLNEYAWKGLGHSIFREPKPDYAYHCSGMEAGNLKSPLVEYYRRAWDISSMIIKGDYWRR